MENNKLNQLNALSYKVLMAEKNNSFTAVVPELSLVAAGKSADEAYQNLKLLKTKYFSEMLELGLGDEITLPASHLAVVKDVALNLRYKIGHYIILFIFIISAFFIMKTSTESALKAAGKAINGKLMAELEKGANPEVKEKRLERFKNVLNVYSPFLYELKKTWQGEDQIPVVKK